jgi:hypothetical protein
VVVTGNAGSCVVVVTTVGAGAATVAVGAGPCLGGSLPAETGEGARVGVFVWREGRRGGAVLPRCLGRTWTRKCFVVVACSDVSARGGRRRTGVSDLDFVPPVAGDGKTPKTVSTPYKQTAAPAESNNSRIPSSQAATFVRTLPLSG